MNAGTEWAPDRQSLGRRLSREPLVHFFTIGILVFVGYRLLHPEVSVRSRYSIELTQDDLAQMSVAWLAQERPAPTAEEMNHLIEDRVRQEVLYREGLALGLDQGDEIIKRRMVQKMDFLAEDLSALQDPDPAELRSWFEKNAARFTVPGRLTFRHLYFSPDRRGTIALAGASAAKTRLAGKRENWQGAATLGDPFMFQDRYTGRSLEQVSAAFGGDFARALFTLPVGSWQGPIESGLGWHVVFVESAEAPRAPTFEEAESDARDAFLQEKRTAIKEKTYAEMRARYHVVLPPGYDAGALSKTLQAVPGGPASF